MTFKFGMLIFVVQNLLCIVVITKEKIEMSNGNVV